MIDMVERRNWVRDQYDAGRTQRDIATELGVTPGRVHQILELSKRDDRKRNLRVAQSLFFVAVHKDALVRMERHYADRAPQE